jgi:hypothetical protein
MGLVIERDIPAHLDGGLILRSCMSNDVSKLLAADPFSLVVPFIGVRFSAMYAVLETAQTLVQRAIEEYD